MKKLIFTSSMVLLLLVGMGSNTAKAQHDVKFNFLGFLFNSYGLGYEYVISEEMGAGAAVNYTVIKSSLNNEDYKWTGFNIAPNFRFYFNPDDDAEGIYVEGYLKFRSLKASGSGLYVDLYEDTDGDGVEDAYVKHEYTQSQSGLALGIAGGRKWVTNSGFFFETMVGVGKYLIDGDIKYSDPDVEEYYNDGDNDIDTNLSSLDFRLAIYIGWRFGG